MSRIKPYLNRLEELFSGTQPVSPEPVNSPPRDPVSGSHPVDSSETLPGSQSEDEVVQISYADIPGAIDRDLSWLLEIGRQMAHAQDLTVLLEQTARLVGEHFELNNVQIYLSEPEKQALLLYGVYGSLGDQLDLGYPLAIDAHSATGIAFTTEQPVFVPASFVSEEDTHLTAYAELALPLLIGINTVDMGMKPGLIPVRGRAFGVLLMRSIQEDSFTPGRRLVFELLANRLAAAVENQRLADHESYPAEIQAHMGWDEFLDAINRKDQIGFSYESGPAETVSELTAPLQEEEAQTISDEVLTTRLQVGSETIGTLRLERAPSDGHNPETEGLLGGNSFASDGPHHPAWKSGEVELVKSIADRVAQHLENLRLLAQAESYRVEAESVARRLTREGWESYLETPQAPLNGYVYDMDMVKPLGGTIQFGEPGIMESSSSPLASSQFAPVHQTTSAIKVRNETIGEVAVSDVEQDDELAAGILAAVTERLGTHIENLRLLEETERGRQQLDKRAAELETVARVSTAAATILSPQELLQSVVDLTKYSFNLYHTQVYLMDSEKTTLVLKAGAGKVGHRMVSEGETININSMNTVVVRAANSRKGVVVNDIRLDKDFVTHPLLSDAMSEMAVPMIVGDLLVGVFDVLASVTNRFTDEDMRTYNTLASQVAVALRNAELYAEQMATVARLRELDHLKSSFLANMSHELRTPLNSILGFAQVIIEGLDGPLTSDMINDLGLIDKNGKHLLNLINEVLDMAKIEAGRLSLSPEPVNLRALIEDVMDSSASLMRDQSLYLRIDKPEQADFSLILDYTRMRQVFINLIGNASKFTETGGLTIDFTQQANKIAIRFKDTGIGIPPNKLDMIFEQFSQVDTSTTRKAGGTGLGLPISRRLVELHGGRLWADSKGIPGEGSVFTVELPLIPVAKV